MTVCAAGCRADWRRTGETSPLENTTNTFNTVDLWLVQSTMAHWRQNIAVDFDASVDDRKSPRPSLVHIGVEFDGDKFHTSLNETTGDKLSPGDILSPVWTRLQKKPFDSDTR